MRRTYPTKCPVCKANVFYHTNGYGDCVYFNAITGAPWPVHECWKRRSHFPTRAQRLRTKDSELYRLSELKEVATGSRPVVVERVPGESAVDRILRVNGARKRAYHEYLELKALIRQQRRGLNGRQGT